MDVLLLFFISNKGLVPNEYVFLLSVSNQSGYYTCNKVTRDKYASTDWEVYWNRESIWEESGSKQQIEKRDGKVCKSFKGIELPARTSGTTLPASNNSPFPSFRFSYPLPAVPTKGSLVMTVTGPRITFLLWIIYKTKYMKQSYSHIGKQAVQTMMPKEKGNKWGEPSNRSTSAWRRLSSHWAGREWNKDLKGAQQSQGDRNPAGQGG